MAEKRSAPDTVQPTPDGGRPKRARRPPTRFEFNEEHGYDRRFLEALEREALKDVDEDWDADLSAEEAPHNPDVSEDEDFSEPGTGEDLDDSTIPSSDEEASDSDEYIGEQDEDLSDSEVVDLNNLPEGEEEDDEDGDDDGDDGDESESFQVEETPKPKPTKKAATKKAAAAGVLEI